MKKIVIIVALILFAGQSICFGEWDVTLTWDRSTGPNLDYEEVRMDGKVIKTVQETEPTEHKFKMDNLSNQKIEIVSFNAQGAENGYVLGTLIPAPAPASRGNILIKWTSP